MSWCHCKKYLYSKQSVIKIIPAQDGHSSQARPGTTWAQIGHTELRKQTKIRRFLQTTSCHMNRQEKTRKASSCAGFRGILAERAGFEPAVGYYPTHAFQACDLNHSSISPEARILTEAWPINKRQRRFGSLKYRPSAADVSIRPHATD